MIRLMVEKVGGGYVPIIQYTPGTDDQHEHADQVVRALAFTGGVRAYVEDTKDADQ